MKFDRSPDIEDAVDILRQIAQKPICVGPRKVDKPLALFGAGNLGRMASQYFAKLGISFDFVVDSNPEFYRDDPFWVGVNIRSPKDPSPRERTGFLLAVCVATTRFSQIDAELRSQGWTDVAPFYDVAEAYRDHHPLGNGWFSGKLDQTDIANIEVALSGWQDATSRAHYLQFIAWHTLREDWVFDDAPITIGDRYFIPEVVSLLRGDEVFCDLGAHHAEVTFRFLQTTKNRFREIWAIEPDIENLTQLRAELKKLDLEIRKKVNVLTCAVAAKEGRGEFFHGLGYASQLCALGQHTVEVAKFDQLGLAPTLIKLHLEGGELDAMHGAVQSLRQHRPIIAATTYHSRQGLWESPRWLMGELTNYKSFFRLHSWCGTGAVAYAIPNERIKHEASNEMLIM